MIHKTVMMEHFDTLNTVGIRKEEAMRLAQEAERSRNFEPLLGTVTVGLSSGTSGNRGLFLVSEQERAAWVGTMLAKVLPKPPWEPQKIAFFLRANSTLYESARQGRLQFRYFDMLAPMEQHITALEVYKPTLLVAPPSILRQLAKAKREEKLSIHPERVISVAEVLDPLDAQYIREAFGTLLHQVYQCTEGFLASTCSHGTIHLNEDIVCIEKESLGEGRFVPIVTDFSRMTQPIVRYRLNDILVEAEKPCPCGSVFTAIERIEGRCDDVLYLRPVNDDTSCVPIYSDYITRAIIGSSFHIEEYRVIQHSEGELLIYLRTGFGEGQGADNRGRQQEIQRRVTEAIHTLCSALRCRPPVIQYEAYTPVPGLQKLRRVERSFPIHEV